MLRPGLQASFVCSPGLSPKPVLSAYHAFHTHSSIHHLIDKTLGKPYGHSRGIPQGCPFSMLFISLYLRAWILQMRQYQLKARTLADDLFLSVIGQRCLSIFQFAFALTIQHSVDLGGRISAHKSTVFATCHTHKTWLGSYLWPCMLATIRVVGHIRDLGA